MKYNCDLQGFFLLNGVKLIKCVMYVCITTCCHSEFVCISRVDGNAATDRASHIEMFD